MFEIGQKVVCVKTHSRGLVNDGEIYTIINLKLCTKCKSLDVNVGVKTEHKYIECTCGEIEKSKGVAWLDYRLFKPLDNLYNEEIEELMQQVYEKQPFEL
jgi:hypothetical protein